MITRCSSPSLVSSLIRCALLFGLATWVGCDGGSTPADAEKQAPPTSQKQTAPEQVPAPSVSDGQGARATPPAAASTDTAPPRLESPGQAAPAAPQVAADAQAILKQMVDAYAGAKSYSDKGTVRMEIDRTQDPVAPQQAPFAVSLVRPSQLRASIYQATVVCNGETLYATIDGFEPQVLRRKAPQELTAYDVYADPMLLQVMTRGVAGASPQLLLLLEKDPIVPLLAGSEAVTLDEPAEIDGRMCHRIKIRRPEGTSVLWIDQQTHVLRRFAYPTEEMLRMMAAQEGPVNSVSLVADFTGAAIDDPVDASIFQFQPPSQSEIVEFFIPPHPGQLLAKMVPPFEFTDLSGQKFTEIDIAGKVAVIDFWATWCGPCRQSLPELDRVREKYKENPNVVFLAVSVDYSNVPDDALTKTFQELGVSLPIYRDTSGSMMNTFRVSDIPSQFLVDAKGVVQDFELGANPKLFEELTKKIEDALAGKEDIYEPRMKAYEQEIGRYGDQVRRMQQGEDPVATEEPLPQAQVAAKSEPSSLRLAPAWKLAEVEAPGNMAIVADSSGAPRLLVIEKWKNLVEIGLDGKLIARHALPIEEQELVTAIRTVRLGDGALRVALFGTQQQRLHLLGENAKLLWSYPADALQSPHSGMTDVQFADLAGDGTPELYVGYAGVVGVQAVSLAGERTAANRSLVNVFRMAAGPQAPNKQRALFCTQSEGSLAVLDATLTRVGSVFIENRMLYYATSAELTAPGQLAWCGLYAPRLGENVALGFDLDGSELWNYALPPGVQHTPVEPVIAGNLIPGQSGQWILPGPDGSIHILSAEGKLVDHFNYGALIHGLAVAPGAGASSAAGANASPPLLIVATETGVEAWRVE
ncbi:MAG: redoxin domain-containing protein [Planctomycetota bacterium]